MTTHYHTVIIGGGQCGLAASYWLTRRGVEHIILEARQPAAAWRTRWDAFALNTPNDLTFLLPGLPYAGTDPDGYAGRAEVVAYFDQHLASFPPPVVAAQATRIAPASPRGFSIETAETTYQSEHVVIAIGDQQRPNMPGFSAWLPPRMTQLHSEDYRNAAALPDGGVLVVGSGSSGCQIAEDLRAAGREVYLSVGRSQRAPRWYRGQDISRWQHVGAIADIVRRRQWRAYLSGKHGRRDLDVRHLAQAGVRLIGRLDTIAGERLTLRPDLHASLTEADDYYADICRTIDAFISDTGLVAPPAPPVVAPPAAPDMPQPAGLELERAGVSSVVWCTGYRRDYTWIDLPAFDAAGVPIHTRGVSTVPGVYFPGIQSAWPDRSVLLTGVDREARYVVGHMLGEEPSPPGPLSQPDGRGGDSC